MVGVVSFVACSGLRGGIGNVVGALGVDEVVFGDENVVGDEDVVGILAACVSVDTGCCEG